MRRDNFYSLLKSIREALCTRCDNFYNLSDSIREALCTRCDNFYNYSDPIREAFCRRCDCFCILSRSLLPIVSSLILCLLYNAQILCYSILCYAIQFYRHVPPRANNHRFHHHWPTNSPPGPIQLLASFLSQLSHLKAVLPPSTEYQG
jgi:hypothetical protein